MNIPVVKPVLYNYRHSQLTNHDINFVSPSILAHDNVKLRLQIKKTLLIKDESPFNSLNKNIGSLPLTLWESDYIHSNSYDLV